MDPTQRTGLWPSAVLAASGLTGWRGSGSAAWLVAHGRGRRPGYAAAGEKGEKPEKGGAAVGIEPGSRARALGEQASGAERKMVRERENAG